MLAGSTSRRAKANRQQAPFPRRKLPEDAGNQELHNTSLAGGVLSAYDRYRPTVCCRNSAPVDGVAGKQDSSRPQIQSLVQKGSVE